MMTKRLSHLVLSAMVSAISFLFLATHCWADDGSSKGDYWERYHRKNAQLKNSHRKNYNYKGEMGEPVVFIPCKRLKEGLYLGGGWGYDAYKIRQSVSLTDRGGTFDQGNPTVSAKGFVARLFVGYGQYFDWFYFGGEAFVNTSGANTTYFINDYGTDISARTGFGIGLLPGLKLSDLSLLYMRLGYARTSLKIQENGAIAGNVSTTDWANGLTYGLGIETAIINNVSIRGEYSYTTYGSFTSNLGTRFSPSNNQFILDFSYHFSC
jgi:opacity protein-like surface antigen